LTAQHTADTISQSPLLAPRLRKRPAGISSRGLSCSIVHLDGRTEYNPGVRKAVEHFGSGDSLPTLPAPSEWRVVKLVCSHAPRAIETNPVTDPTDETASQETRPTSARGDDRSRLRSRNREPRLLCRQFVRIRGASETHPIVRWQRGVGPRRKGGLASRTGRARKPNNSGLCCTLHPGGFLTSNRSASTGLYSRSSLGESRKRRPTARFWWGRVGFLPSSHLGDIYQTSVTAGRESRKGTASAPSSAQPGGSPLKHLDRELDRRRVQVFVPTKFRPDPEDRRCMYRFRERK